MAIELKTPLGSAAARALRAGDMCLLTGELYTARDAAHKRLCTLLEAGQPLPFDIRGAVIYFVGPTPAKPGQAIGSAGPTTSYRMDTYSPALLRQGLTGMIGKGKRSEAVIEAIRACGAVYFGATGGCGALLSRCIKKAEIIAYPDLGPEAVRRLYVENFPVTVIIDSEGNNLYEIGRQNYLDSMRQREACGSGV